MRFHALALVSVIVPCALAACSDDATSSSTTTTVDGGATSSPDAGPVAPTDGGEPPATDAAPDAPSGPAIRCTQAEFDKVAGAGGGDFTGFPGADISFFFTGAPQQYVNHCVKVKVGSDVTFAGDFSMHPLRPAGGDSPNPIPATSANPPNNAVTLKVTAAGTFGFECANHPTVMFGAVQVVP